MTYAILFVLLIPVGITLFVLFDLIVRLEYKRHRNDWEKDQKPIGFFWRPRGASVWSGSVARSKLAGTWLFNTAEWMLEDQTALRLLFWYRWVWRIVMVGWLASVVYLIVGEST